ncbi:hypothetical protein QJS10_CPA02g00234 [Acorus calamus]|uniref:Uncharacterized protein n=1 Tax=Acorus calamus TaxID=4465 RepID=A0AAV9FHQ7_ACOCL|nr:hypothetical protein QJS10_CPA02g00234 [Acorus calamus]
MDDDVFTATTPQNGPPWLPEQENDIFSPPLSPLSVPKPNKLKKVRRRSHGRPFEGIDRYNYARISENKLVFEFQEYYIGIRGLHIKSTEDLSYLSKLAAGSVGGAIFIKYGSALIPEITKPNGFVALLLVGLPMLVSVFLLSKAK